MSHFFINENDELTVFSIYLSYASPSQKCAQEYYAHESW